MKAVVLSGGQGTRLRPVTYSMPKQLVPVGGMPVLGHILSDIKQCGITEIAVVTSREFTGVISGLLDEMGMDGSVLAQPEPRGLADAFSVALPFVDGDDCLLYLGDCLVTGGVGHMVQEHRISGADATILVKEVDDPSRYGIVELGDDGVIVKLVEKPDDPPSRLAIVGAYVFSGGVGEVAMEVQPSWRGELEITDAIQLIVDGGGIVRSSELRGWWVDTGTIDDVFAANAKLLESIDPDVLASVEGCDVTGEWAAGPGASVSGSTIIGPVVVGPGTVIEGSTIGPNVTIGRDSVVRDAILSESILMDRVQVADARLVRSLLGPGSVIDGIGPHSELSIVVGADSEIGSASSSHSG